MNKRQVRWGALGAAAFFWPGAGPGFSRCRPRRRLAAAPPIAQEEADATLAALKPPKRERPLIAIVGINDATETTDYLMPYGILRRADVADVVALATGAGAGEALSGAQGRAGGDDRGLRRASIRKAPTTSSCPP